jgi:hypothetical protein
MMDGRPARGYRINDKQFKITYLCYGSKPAPSNFYQEVERFWSGLQVNDPLVQAGGLSRKSAQEKQLMLRKD